MKLRLLLAGGLAALLAVAGARPAHAARVSWVKDYAEGMAKARTEKRPVVLDFYADWCGWCKVMDRETYGNAGVAAVLTNYICIKVDVEQDTDTAFTFRIGSLPRTIVVDAEGRLLGDRVGYLQPEPFLAFLQDAAQSASPEAPIVPGQERALFLSRMAELSATARTNQAALAELVDHLDHPEATVRKAAREALEKAGPVAIPVLLPLLAHEKLETRIASHAILMQLADDTPGFDPWAGRAERQAALVEWEHWLDGQAKP